MAALRWILLAGGVLLLVAIAAWELRRPRQGKPDADRAERGERIDPERFDPGPIGEAAPERAPAAVEPVYATRSRLAEPPLIDLPPLDMDGPESLASVYEPTLMSEPLVRHVDEPPLGELPAPPDEAPAAGEQPDGGAPALVVDWPADEERTVITLRLAPAAGERLPGRAVRQALAASGFVHGRFGIFHQPGLDGRALLSVASATKPGIFDPSNMDFQRFGGLALFAVLPGPLPAAATLDHLIDSGRELAQRLGARLQDEHGEGLDAERLEGLRQSLLSQPAEPTA